MTAWFRMYSDLLNDPKVQRLSGETFKGWVNVLCLAAQNDGQIPCDDDVAFAMRIDSKKAAKLMIDLRDAGLVDVSETGRTPHNWNGRQYKSDVSTDRVKRFRERSLKQERNVSATPPETAPDTEQNRADIPLDKSNGAKPASDVEFWASAKLYLGGKNAGALIGKWCRDYGKVETASALTAAQVERAVDPVSYIEKVLRKTRANDDGDEHFTGFC